MDFSTMDSSGTIIAFEGNQDVVSTQLRLLPTSSQILILPSIDTYLPFDTDSSDFESHTYIQKVHDAAKSRHNAAREFLQDSTASGKKFVFVNGGTSHAHSLCIKAIMKHDTEGDAVKAERTFKNLVRNGISGLGNVRSTADRAETPSSFYDQEDLEDHYRLDDPVTRAMRAAETLDRLTASLQPTNDLDLTVASHSRSSSLPLYGYSDDFQDSAPFFVFGGVQQDEHDHHKFLDDDSSRPSPPRIISSHSDKLLELYENPSDASPLPPLSPHSPFSCVTESCASSPHGSPISALETPWSDVFSPFSPQPSQTVIFGEAAMLDVRATNLKAARRTKSLDRVYTVSPKLRDLCLPLETPKSGDGNATQGEIDSGIVETEASYNHETSCLDVPRTIMIKPARPTISIDPVPGDKRRKGSRRANGGLEAMTATATAVKEPLLPFTESLVVYFKDDNTDLVLETVIDSFKEGTYPSSPSAGSDGAEVDTSLPQTPQSPQMFQRYRLSVVSEEPSSSTAGKDEYDPFAYTGAGWPQPKSPRRAPSSISTDRPPTPQRTPTPSMIDQRECFHDFNITGQQTAVTIQNTLRSILNVYYPPDAPSYGQFQFLLPELEGFCNPLLREGESRSNQKRRKMDQIVAIGSQRGVSKAFTTTVAEQLEKLGTASSGVKRCGRLDFRHLLVNAMQVFTAQPLANQTCDNPFSNPYLLATLIVPHLAAYLGVHPEHRYLLLEYPPEHLPTILALQKLVGVDLMKVAQIVDASSNEQLPFTHIRGAAIGKHAASPKLLGAHNRSQSSPKAVSTNVAFTKANFLLTSTAIESEVDTFVETIHKILIDISPFYKPKDSPKKETSSKSKTRGSRAAISPYPKINTAAFGPASTVTPPYSMSPTSPRHISWGETTVSTMGYSKHSRTPRRRHISGADYISNYTLDFSVDMDLRKEARRLMPMYMHKPSRSEGSSQKALKFLGLV
jgi:hypothetical protein